MFGTQTLPLRIHRVTGSRSAFGPMSLPKRLSDESGEVYWNPVQLARISGCQGMIIDSHERGHAHLVHLKLPADRSHGIQWSNNLKKNMSTSNAVWRYLASKSEASGDIETCALASAPGLQYYNARAMRAASKFGTPHWGPTTVEPGIYRQGRLPDLKWNSEVDRTC